MNNSKIAECLDLINNIIGIIGFIISIASFFMIKNVEKRLAEQKETILFNRKYKQFCDEITNIIVIIKKDGTKNTYPAIIDLCDKIVRCTGGTGKKEQKELNSHIKSIKKAHETCDHNATEKIELELISIRNLLESVGEKNGI